MSEAPRSPDLAAAFAPLTDAERAGPPARESAGAPAWRELQPVPDGVAAPDFAHTTLGEPDNVPGNPWRYTDAAGRTLGYVVRFAAPGGGKTFRPLVYAEHATTGRRAWRWQGFPKPRPLYGLAELAARPEARAIVLEGEKAAGAARRLFPDCVAVSPMHGAESPALAAWDAVKARHVVVWPDADDVGRGFARKVASLALEAGAASVGIVPVPGELPEGWDVADALPPGWDAARLRALLEAAEPVDLKAPSPEAVVPFPFRLTADAVEYAEDREGGREWVRVCSRLEVLALTRSESGEDWGSLLRWTDDDGRTHEWALASEMLASQDGREWLAELRRRGLTVSPGQRARQRLHEYVDTTRPAARVRCVSRVGWHDRVYVLPDATFGPASGERVLLQTGAPLHHAFRVAGTLEEWRREVAAPCAGNSRLVLALSAALAPPLLELLGAESGGFHFRGDSSVGKTTALRVAGSVWGGGGVRGYVGTWRATANGLEGVAAAHCDALLCLDELSEVDAREAGAVAYMLANGAGKARAGRDGGARRGAEWRLLFLSSGELGIADKVREDGRRRVTAGQAVRVVDVPADAGTGLGLFEDLHGCEDPGAFAQRLGAAARTYYGTAARAFVAALTEDREGAEASAREYREGFLEEHAPKDADGQVRRVAERFALVGAAGEMATSLGVVPWKEGKATKGAAACLAAWLAERGGTGPAELTAALDRVRSFFVTHGASRFDPAADGVAAGLPVRDRAGWWRLAEDSRREWLVPPNVFRDELAQGSDPRALARACIERGWLRPACDGRSSRPERVPGHGKPRVYVFSSAVVDDDDAS